MNTDSEILRRTGNAHLRVLTEQDLPFADSLRQVAGWNQTLADWKRFLDLSRNGCFLAEWDGTPAGTATTICHGKDLAWIGMVLVHPEFRGRGLGRALLERCLEHLRGQGIGCIKLDATPAGERIYDQLGFREEWALTRWELRTPPMVLARVSDPLRACIESDTAAVVELDEVGFGTARPSLLQSLLSQCRQALVEGSAAGLEGYGVLRDGTRACYLGPVAAVSEEPAARIVRALVSSASGNPIYWDIPDLNSHAVALAKELGFTPQRALRRMLLGENKHPGNPQTYFAIADPAVG
jgi:GNAT superfamily N-acetyltransferase